VALVAVAAGTAANGGNFILGATNTATLRTTLSSTASDATMLLTNTGTGVPLTLQPAAGKPPLKVGSSVLVTGLNADKVDGLDASAFWSLTGNAGTGGKNFLGTTDNRPLNLWVNNARAFRLEPGDANGPNVIGGASTNAVTTGKGSATIGGGGSPLSPSFGNRVTDDFGTVSGGQRNSAGLKATIGGGDQNTASHEGDTVSGGKQNGAIGGESAVGGGQGNVASGSISTAAGGYQNTADGNFAAIGGGFQNTVTGNQGTIAGGDENTVGPGFWSSIGGGFSNTASGTYAVVPGGRQNVASADYSSAAGFGAQADDVGAYVWADASGGTIASPGTNTFSVRAAGGIWLGTNSSPSIGGGHFIDTSTGAYLSTAGVWTDNSSRALKHEFRPLSKSSVLQKVGRMPIQSWSYKAESPSIRHVGPTAQSFYKAFGLGLDNKHIGSIDESGVALAAIQGLYRQNLALKTRLAKLEKTVARMQAKR